MKLVDTLKETKLLLFHILQNGLKLNLCDCKQTNIHTNKQTDIEAKDYQTAAINQRSEWAARFNIILSDMYLKLT